MSRQQPQRQRTEVRNNHNFHDSRAQQTRHFSAPPVVIRNNEHNRYMSAPAGRNVVYRSGYTQYTTTWRDRDFWYPHYEYVYHEGCAPSPWYWYPNLPGYVAIVSIRPISGLTFNFMFGQPYVYRPYYYRDFDESRLDIVADRLTISFRDRDFDRASWMIDPDTWVQIQVGDRNNYDLRGQDYRAMMRDMIHDTRTVSYEITSVRRWDNGGAIVARHVYIDPWGEREVVLHRYGLRRTPRGYVVVSFRTDLG